MKLATVCRIEMIRKHPNADKLEVMFLNWSKPDEHDGWDETVVTGKHYREGDLGLFIPHGALLPGYLAHQEMWLCGRGKAMEWFSIVRKNMRGVNSPGIFSGQFYKHDRERDTEWTKWSYWCDWWKLGDDVAAYLGIREDPTLGYGSAPEA